MNRSALAYWRATGYTRAGIDQICHNLDRSVMAARIEFFGNGQAEVRVTQRTANGDGAHWNVVLRLVRDLGSHPKCQLKKGVLLLWLHDGLVFEPPWTTQEITRQVPILCYGRSCFDHYSFLIPDPSFLENKGYSLERAELATIADSTPWELKKPTLFWRGANTGIKMYSSDWENSPRLILARMSRDLANPNRLDAKVSKVINYGDVKKDQRIAQMKIVGEPVPFTEFTRYRYQIDLDGEHCAWKSFLLKLCFGSLVIKCQSEFEQWYYNKLVPFEHYLPARPDLSDLFELLDWAEHNDSVCQRIAQSGAKVARAIDYDTTFDEIAALVSDILECQRDLAQ